MYATRGIGFFTMTVGAVMIGMEYGRATVQDGRPYTFGDDQFVGAIAREAYSDAWQTFQTWIFRYAGSSAGKRGLKLERVLRDMAIGWSHFNTAQHDWGVVEVAKSRLGLPPGSLF
jgi:hypothetical protein